MRKTLYFLLAFCLIVSTAKGVNASTDCQRWLADYKKTLAEKTTAQHLLAARNRARAAARRKLAHLTEVPARPVPTRISSVRPHMSPAQMLKRFDLLCGDLPVENQVLDSRMAPDEFISEVSMGGPVDLLASPVDGLLVADNVPPTAPVTGIVPDSPSGGDAAGAGFRADRRTGRGADHGRNRGADGTWQSVHPIPSGRSRCACCADLAGSRTEQHRIDVFGCAGRGGSCGQTKRELARPSS